MNSVFRSYPPHPWFAEWTLEPRGCKASFRQNGAGLFFRTLDEAGRLAPNTPSPAWALQVPIARDARINMLFNGFCAYHERKKVGTEVLVPEPGVLWGRANGPQPPVLASEAAIVEHDGYQWMESEAGAALVMTRGELFCLVSKSHVLEDALNIAERYLENDLEATLRDELEKRAGAHNLFMEMAHHDALAVISAESLMKSLRPAEGKLPHAWCQSSATDEPAMDANELHPLALAWSMMEPATAEELVLCALKTQSNAGAIATRTAPRGPGPYLEAPKPYLAKTCEAVWEVSGNPDFLSTALPLLRRHTQWLLHHFDPKRAGLHIWKTSAEPLAPNMHETDRATVDLSVLLITEIDALNRLRAQTPSLAAEPDFFEPERKILRNNIMELFWDGGARAFHNTMTRGLPGTLDGFASFTPLIWRDLPHDHRDAILEHVRQSGTLPGGVSVLTWRKSAMDDNSFPLNQQLFVLEALRTAAPHGQLLNDFSRVTLQGFIEWHTLVLEKENRLRVNPVMSAFIMNTQSIRQYRYHAKSGLSAKLFRFFRKHRADRFDLAVVGATLFALVATRLLYSEATAPPPLELLTAQMNAAYARHAPAETLENCMAIIHHYPDQADTALLYAANVAMLHNDFSRAAKLLERARARQPDSPSLMISQALAYHHLGRYKEAAETYYEFCFIFEEIFPTLVKKIERFRYLALEGLSSPPKWREIYGYQLMHQL